MILTRFSNLHHSSELLILIVGIVFFSSQFTGLHSVADIYCDCCHTVLGWKYEQAFESSQKYKEGKYIIELAHLIKDNGWDWVVSELEQRRPY